MSFSYFKTSRLERRRKQLSKDRATPLEVVHRIETKDVLRLEQCLHDAFKSKRIRNEMIVLYIFRATAINTSIHYFILFLCMPLNFSKDLIDPRPSNDKVNGINPSVSISGRTTSELSTAKIHTAIG